MAPERRDDERVNREQLAHILRSSARIASDGDIVVIGSQAILGSYRHDELPSEAYVSMEADVAFRDDPDDAKADLVDGMIGEGSGFNAEFSYYAQGVSIATAVLPAGWDERLVPFDRPDALPSRAVCLEAHDLVVSKLVAGREKDVEFATALLRSGLVSDDTLLERAGMLDRPGAVIKRVRSAIRRCTRRARSG